MMIVVVVLIAVTVIVIVRWRHNHNRGNFGINNDQSCPADSTNSSYLVANM